ncbi:MAG TPA: hypothetical protein VLT82_20755 [Myxococcaceae bacterium]|nr:hypothetical protein [Myxococcaceae bacterium]
MTLFRERLLARLVERHTTPREPAQKLLAWSHPPFSAPPHRGHPRRWNGARGEAWGLLVLNLSLQRLVYLPAH